VEVLIGWDGKQRDPEGWIKKSVDEMTLESGLSKYQQEQAIKRLLSLGYIEKKLKCIPATNHFRIKYPVLQERWIEWMKTHPPPEKKRRRVKQEVDSQLARNQSTTTYATHDYTHRPTAELENSSRTESQTNNKDGFELFAGISMRKGKELALRESRKRANAKKRPKVARTIPTHQPVVHSQLNTTKPFPLPGSEH
jgi:DNA-binding transcriptional MocR family regulator